MDSKILIVDDDKDMLDLLVMNLNDRGFTNLGTAGNAVDAMASVRQERPDLILLDVMLPDKSGIELTGKLKNRAETAGIPVILLTGKDSETDMVVGLSVGADDYVTKPFSIEVLVARIEAVLRRVYPDTEDVNEILCAGAIKVVISTERVYVDETPVELTGGEYKILLGLMRGGGKILSRGKLVAYLGSDTNGQGKRIVDVHIASIRKKLGLAGGIIKTAHGRGYRLDV